MNGKTEEAPKAAARTEHTLLKPHRHSGKDCEKGEKIKLTASQSKRLKAQDVIG